MVIKAPGMVRSQNPSYEETSETEVPSLSPGKLQDPLAFSANLLAN